MTADATAAAPSTKDLSARRITSFILWRVPLFLFLIGLLWTPSRGVLWTVGCEWIGGACLANAIRCGRVHCAVMGPLFIVVGLVSLAKTIELIALDWLWILTPAGIGTLVAYVPEFLGKKYFGKDPACET